MKFIYDETQIVCLECGSTSYTIIGGDIDTGFLESECNECYNVDEYKLVDEKEN